MYQLIFVFVNLGLALCAPVPSEDLPVLGIVGGERANQKLFKYQISLEQNGKHRCGGALVTTNIVITAAHCTLGIHESAFRVRVGSGGRETGGKVYHVQFLVNHPEFSFEGMHSDVAIIKLTENVKLGKNVGTITLTDKEPAGNTIAKISGWGHTKEKGQLSKDLMFAEVTVFERAYCEKQLDPMTPEMFCAGRKEGGVDSCQADSGGPLVVNNKLIGIISWGDGCGRPGSPGVYTNVAVMRPWIDRTINRLIQI